MTMKRTIYGMKYYTPPLPIIDLSVSHQFAYSLVFIFTPRAITTLPITHYEVHLNGSYYGNITGPDGYISGLNPGTLYSNITIIAVDESGGKSTHSNSVNATTGNPAVQTSGLAISYAMEGLSGAVVDGSGNGLDGIIQGTGVTRGNLGLVNNCFKFDTNGAIETFDNPLLRTTDGVNVGKIAFSVWINADALNPSTNHHYFFSKSNGVGAAVGMEYQFLWNGTYMNFSSYNKDGSPALVYRRNVREYDLGEKVFFSGIMDFQNKVVKLFKNGIELPGTHNLIGSGNFDLNVSSNPVTIGSLEYRSFDTTYNYSGLMDEFRFWNGDIPHPAYFMDEYNNGNGITL